MRKDRFEKENFHLILANGFRCYGCGFVNPTGTKYCEDCGEELRNKLPAQKFKNGQRLSYHTDLKSLVRDGFKIAVVCGGNSETKKGKLYAIDFDPGYLTKAGIPFSFARDYSKLGEANTLTRIGPREGSFTQFVRVANGGETPDEYFIRGCERVQGTMQYSLIPPGHGWWLDGGRQPIADWEGVKKVYRKWGWIDPGWNPRFKKEDSKRRTRKEEGKRVSGFSFVPESAKTRAWWATIRTNYIPEQVAPREHGGSAPRTLMRRIIAYAHEVDVPLREIRPTVNTMADDMHLNRVQRTWVKDRLEYEYTG